MPRSVDPAAAPAADRPWSRTLASPLLWIAVIYLAVFALLRHDGFWINDNGLKFLQVQAIEASHYGDYSLPWPGRAIDPGFEFTPLSPGFGWIVGDRLYASYSPVFALVSSIPHQLFGFPGLVLLPLAGTLAVLLAVRRLAALLSPDLELAAAAGKIAVVLTALAGPVWFYSFTFWEHTPALAFATWAIVAYVRFLARPTHERAAVLGLLASLTIYFRPEAYLLAALLWGACILRRPQQWRSAATLALALVVSLVPLWSFQWLATHHPLGPHLLSQPWGTLDLGSFLSQRLESVENILLNAHGRRAISIAIALPFLVLAATQSRWSDRSPSWLAPLVLAWALCGGLAVLHGHWTAVRPMNWLLRANGLSAVSPIVILAALPLAAARDDTRHENMSVAGGPGAARSAEIPSVGSLRRDLLWLLLLNAGFYALLVPVVNTSGVHWGCRFALVAYPMLAALSAPVFVQLWRRSGGTRGVTRVLLGATLALSIATQLYSLELLRARKEFSSRLAERIEATPADLIATTRWHIPQDLARIFYQRPIFWTPSRAKERALLARAHASGSRTALLLDFVRPGTPAPEGATLLSDGWLRFCPLALRRVELGSQDAEHR
jgi:hypothetical protein